MYVDTFSYMYAENGTTNRWAPRDISLLSLMYNRILTPRDISLLSLLYNRILTHREQRTFHTFYLLAYERDIADTHSIPHDRAFGSVPDGEDINNFEIPNSTIINRNIHQFIEPIQPPLPDLPEDLNAVHLKYSCYSYITFSIILVLLCAICTTHAINIFYLTRCVFCCWSGQCDRFTSVHSL